jgi:predicted nucleic acid-binding protein
MILADTSVWIDHFRRGDATLVALLDSRSVLMHPFVLGEVALGHLPRRAEILMRLSRLPQAAVASAGEVLVFIDRQELVATGLGYVDVHLLASLRLTPDALLWTRDKKLKQIAQNLALSAEP